MANLEKRILDRGSGFSADKFIKKISSSLPVHLKDNKSAMAGAMKGLERKIRYGYLTDQDIKGAIRKFKGLNKASYSDVDSFKKLLTPYSTATQRAEKKEKLAAIQGKPKTSGSFWGILGSKKKEEKPPVLRGARAYDPEAMAAAGRVGYSPSQRGFAGGGAGDTSSQKMSGSMVYLNRETGGYAKKAGGTSSSPYSLGKKGGVASANQGKSLGSGRLKPVI
ncbi:MAG: hypothetical protein WC745_04245 [Patescibacteria group bacterium]|jgi:hypothetical protein